MHLIKKDSEDGIKHLARSNDVEILNFLDLEIDSLNLPDIEKNFKTKNVIATFIRTIKTNGQN